MAVEVLDGDEVVWSDPIIYPPILPHHVSCGLRGNNLHRNTAQTQIRLLYDSSNWLDLLLFCFLQGLDANLKTLLQRGAVFFFGFLSLQNNNIISATRLSLLSFIYTHTFTPKIFNFPIQIKPEYTQRRAGGDTFKRALSRFDKTLFARVVEYDWMCGNKVSEKFLQLHNKLLLVMLLDVNYW